MKSHARVVVIGGGVVGCSVLYHLTKFGCRDAVLLERKVLTAGSTWHAAAGFHAFNGDPNIARLQAYTISLYQEIQEAGEQNVGLHVPGGINLAATPERWEFLRTEWSRHRFMGLDTHLIGPAEIKKMCPIVDVGDVIGGLYDPHDGHLDPYGCTHAYARAARKNGAEIYQQTKVEALTPRADGGWDVVTDQGAICAEHVINAAGLWAREVGSMAGVRLPLIPMEHHYLITENIPELEALDREIPVTVDLDGEIYLRQEHKGVLLGVYEKNSTPWALNGTPWSYGETDLLPPHLERLEDNLVQGFKRFPSVGAAGIKRVVNGPFTFTPDGNPLVGPVRGLHNYWVACGCMAGFSQGGGVGLALAQWILEGEPQDNVYAMDVARFGAFATPAYTAAKAREFYEHRFYLARPNEQWPAGRPAKTTPVYDLQQAANAVFGVTYGQEMALWFAPKGAQPSETPTFRRSNAFRPVGEECRAVRAGVGVFDASGYAKYDISGPAAETWLDRLLACRLPAIGRARLAPMLAPSGRLMGDLTVMRLAADHFMVTGSGYLQEWHMRWFEHHLPERGVEVSNVSDSLLMLAVAGPKAATLVGRLIGGDHDPAAMPLLSVIERDIGLAPTRLARLSLTGETGYEIYAPSQYLRQLYVRLLEEGRDLGIRPYGVWALLSLRLEKSYGIWSREFATEYTPRMCGLDRFVDYGKADFIGREAALREREATPARQLATFIVDAKDADAAGFEPIWIGERVVGYTTSGGYGHTVGESLAMGYVESADISPDAPYEIHILGERCKARMIMEPAYDPGGGRMRRSAAAR
ncbi:MAG: GcvT family protein [Sphingomonadales bacterium]|nr:GcvT family protein [Sphingomonadales bacterium]